MNTVKSVYKKGSTNLALQWRARMKYTQREAAEVLGLCTATLRLYEYGKQVMPKTTRLAMELLEFKKYGNNACKY